MDSHSPSSSILKQNWLRLAATIPTMLLVYAFTRNAGLALLVGGVEVLVKSLLVRVVLSGDAAKEGEGGLPAAAVLWFTGLSGSGKTTIAKLVLARCKELGIAVEWLDGDVTREFLPQTGFSKADRDANVLQAGFIARMLQKNGITVVASYISPYAETRAKVRAMCGNFIEIYVSTPLEECERRDAKGLYAKARAGEIKNFTGIDDPYEPPQNPELIIDTLNGTPDDGRERVMTFFQDGVRQHRLSKNPDRVET